jgi:ribosomal protein S18 acetylase RimI-like enzyme
MTDLRPAGPADLAAVATLHADRIAEGFLSSLGPAFLRRLYGRVLRSPDGFVLVAADGPRVVGFVAGVADLGRLYKQFVLHDGVVAGLAAAPRLLRAIPHVIETLRYPATTDGLPDAEILAVAVAAAAGGRGVGRALVRAGTDEFTARGIEAAKVVTTADNDPALAMYRAAGFTHAASIEVHEGRASEVLVWNRS